MKEGRTKETDPEARDRSGGGGTLAAVGVASTGVGAALLATVTAACCAGPVIAPIVVAVLGASGAAWAAGLSPYTPYLFAGSAALLGWGFWMVHGPSGRCESDRRQVEHGADRRRVASIAVQVVLWLAALVWLGSVAISVYATLGPSPVG